MTRLLTLKTFAFRAQLVPLFSTDLSSFSRAFVTHLFPFRSRRSCPGLWGHRVRSDVFLHLHPILSVIFPLRPVWFWSTRAVREPSPGLIPGWVSFSVPHQVCFYDTVLCSDGTIHHLVHGRAFWMGSHLQNFNSYGLVYTPPENFDESTFIYVGEAASCQRIYF